MYHKLLQRQLKKYSFPELENHELFQRFIESVNDSYNSFEKDKEISEHAFYLTQNEFSEINFRLKAEIEL